MTFFHLDLHEAAPAVCLGGVLTIGNFDGVHRGHQALLGAICAKAKLLSGPALVMTFDPHPLQLLRPEQFQPVLTTITDRAGLLHQYGADHVVVIRTNAELLALSAREFFEKVIQSKFQANTLVEGDNFGFGRNREGDVGMLKKLARAAGMPLPEIVHALLVDGRPVSSSRVRHALVQGEVEQAAGLLGRSFSVTGIVGAGQQRGKSLGFPTANLHEIGTLVPGDGVYAVTVLYDKRRWPGATNIGVNPTFGETTRKVEVHLIGFKDDLYGQSVRIEFLKRIRDTRSFASITELQSQLKSDVAMALDIYSKKSPAN